MRRKRFVLWMLLLTQASIFFDTANIYGWGENAGLTETIIGKWFKQGGGRREKSRTCHQSIRLHA